jgi:hypothetical protein
MLEMEIQPARVLKSDFQMWHAVLNRCYLERDDADYEAFASARLEGAALEAAVEASWEGVFDLERKTYSKAFWGSSRRAVTQGVLWEIRAADVRSIHSFRAR